MGFFNFNSEPEPEYHNLFHRSDDITPDQIINTALYSGLLTMEQAIKYKTGELSLTDIQEIIKTEDTRRD